MHSLEEGQDIAERPPCTGTAWGVHETPALDEKKAVEPVPTIQQLTEVDVGEQATDDKACDRDVETEGSTVQVVPEFWETAIELPPAATQVDGAIQESERRPNGREEVDKVHELPPSEVWMTDEYGGNPTSEA